MKFSIITIFPELFDSFLKTSLVARALKNEIITIELLSLRDFAAPPHFKVDDSPYGGGPGMVLMPEPLEGAILKAKERLPDAKVVVLTPSGTLLTQGRLTAMTDSHSELILVCGRYEGIDQRIIDLYVDYEISIGDYVLMGGEIPAMVLIEASTRLLGDSIGNPESLEFESFSMDKDNNILLEGPHYTRPAEFKNIAVPEVLLSGDHARIEKWRQQQALEKTKRNRPDLLKKL